MGSTFAEKSEDVLRKEIDELQRQQREVCFFFFFFTCIGIVFLWPCLFILIFPENSQITERLRDPRGLRRGRFPGAGPRNFATNGARQRAFTRPVSLCSFIYFFFLILLYVFCLSLGKLAVPQFFIVCPNLSSSQVRFLSFCVYSFQADRNEAEDEPPAKRRLSSAVVKVKTFAVLV